MDRARSISKSMLSYLKKAREYKELMGKETAEFERGKRHLANIMSMDADEMTQHDIDTAIKYLFPSGLFEPKARPYLKHPELVYRAQKEAQFDENGRPHHHLFYMVKPNYYETLSQMNHKIRELNAYEDEQLGKGILEPPQDASYSIESEGREWLKVEDFRDKFLEKITDHDYQYFIKCLERLCRHPYSSRIKPFIYEYSRVRRGHSSELELPEIKRDQETGQIYTVMECRKRESVYEVKTVLNGSGKFDLDGEDILKFRYPHFRRTIFAPIHLSNMAGKIDIFARTIRRGIIENPEGNNSTAIRWAVSMSIAAFCGKEMQERLRLAGLLTLDKRLKERLKFNQIGARRKKAWSKR